VSYFTLATFSGLAAATRPREGPMVRIRLPPAKSRPRTSRAKSNPLSPGTEGSNPALSRGESTNHRFRRRFHGIEITKEKQRVSEALARADAQREKLTGQHPPPSSGESGANLTLSGTPGSRQDRPFDALRRRRRLRLSMAFTPSNVVATAS
jgi:hypothetical protein